MNQHHGHHGVELSHARIKDLLIKVVELDHEDASEPASDEDFEKAEKSYNRLLAASERLADRGYVFDDAMMELLITMRLLYALQFGPYGSALHVQVAGLISETKIGVLEDFSAHLNATKSTHSLRLPGK